MLVAMATRERPVDVGAGNGRRLVADVARELRQARLDRGLSQDRVGSAVGLSGSRVSRLERGLDDSLTFDQAARLLAVVGLELSVRAYPGGRPIRDSAHAALIGRLRSRLHRSLRLRTEVPLPVSGDQRAWDAVISGHGWLLGVEAETRPRDLQALERRLALKRRDGGVEHVVLLLTDSRHNRDLVRAYGRDLAESFPVPGRRALELLVAGVDPIGSAVLLL
jgi:transcriptional regulator with XRE-family HTH domain